MTNSHRIAIATSIPPHMARLDRGRATGADYQKACVQSWIDCGFRVLSVNAREEVVKLAAQYPDVEFVAVDHVSSRKTPFIADLLKALLAGPEEHLGIVNADILFQPSPAWRHELPELLSRTLIAVQRHDTTALVDGALRRYYWGYDCFFFGRDTASAVLADAGDFAMGLPWWDYWFPAAAMLKDCEVRLLENPLTLHLLHRQGYRNATLQYYAHAFADRIITTAGARELKPEIADLLPLCRGLLAMPDQKDTSEDRTLSDGFAHQIIPWRDALAANAVRLGAIQDGAAPFLRLEDRLWAGAAYESARYHVYLGNPEETARLYRDGLQRTPDDFDLLMGCGQNLCTAKAPAALAMFERARLQQPDNPHVLNAIGVALRGLGRRSEALASFQRASENADFADAAHNFAIALIETGRKQEAAACIAAALRKWPQDTELGRLEAHLAKNTART